MNINNKFTSVQKTQTREMKMESFIPSMVTKENFEEKRLNLSSHCFESFLARTR